MLDEDDIPDEATRRVNDALACGGPIEPADGQACRSASLLLEVADRRASRGDFLRAVAACARAALPAREAATWARGCVSRRVAGVDDDVGMAVAEACDLAAGDAFEPCGLDPAYRAAWAWACLAADPCADRDATRRAYQERQARLADLVRSVIPSLW